MLAGIYYGAQYGGSTTAILINLPGESSSAWSRRSTATRWPGRAAPARRSPPPRSARSSPARSPTFLLALVAPPLAEVALKFGPAEYFSLMVLGLVASVALAQRLAAQGASR